MNSTPLHFVHISDTHIGPHRDYELYGCNTYANAVRIIEAINRIPVVPEFVLHTGDITFEPDENAYQLAAEVFWRLAVPAYFVTGNHDSARMIRKHLTMGEVESISGDDDFLSYSFEKKGYRFITLDARGPEEIDPRGILENHQFDFLQKGLEQSAGPVAVFVHFPPLPLNSVWLDSDMLLTNGERLHEMLLPHREGLRGVFFGHVHRGITVYQDGILYSSVASTIRQFTAWPDDAKAQFDLDHPPSFNFVTLLGSKTIIKEHSAVTP